MINKPQFGKFLCGYILLPLWLFRLVAFSEYTLVILTYCFISSPVLLLWLSPIVQLKKKIGSCHMTHIASETYVKEYLSLTYIKEITTKILNRKALFFFFIIKYICYLTIQVVFVVCFLSSCVLEKFANIFFVLLIIH